MLDNIEFHKKKLSSTTNDTFKLNTFIHLSWDYRNFNVDSAFYYSNQAIDLATTINHDSLLSKALNIKSKIYENVGKYDSAFGNQISSLNLRNRKDYFGRLNNYASIVNILKEQRKFRLAKYYLERAYTLFDTTIAYYSYTSIDNLYHTYYNEFGGNKYDSGIDDYKSERPNINEIDRNIANRLIVQLCNIELTFGEINLNLGNPVKALRNYRNVLRSAVNTDSHDIRKRDYIIYSFYGLANSYYHLENNDSLDKYLELSLYYSRLRPDSLLLAKSLNLEGLVSVKNSKIDDAIELFRMADSIVDESFVFATDIKLNLLNTLIDHRLSPREIDSLQKEVTDKKELMSPSQLIEFNKLMAKYLIKMKDYEEGYKILERVENLKSKKDIDRIRSEILEIQELNNVQELNNNLSEQLDEIDKLNLQKIGITVVLIILTLLILVILFFTFKIRKIKNQLEISNSQLKDKNQKLVELDHNRNELFSMLSHDIKTPLILSNKTLLLLEDQNLSSKNRQEYISQVQITIDKVSSLVESILSWLFSPDVNIDGEFKKNNIKAIVEDALLEYDQFISDKNLNLILKINDVSKVIDKTTFEIIIKNLLSNAIKFSKQNNDLVIYLDKNRLEITNNGIPFDENQIEELNQNRRTYSKKGTQGETGHGLGLQIIKNLVEFNNINLNVHPSGDTTTISLNFDTTNSSSSN